MSLKAKIGAGAAALAVALVVHFEGTVYQVYRDPIEILTACTGHTGPELKMGQTFTKAQCQAMLDEDLLKHAKALECVSKPMTDGQKAAFVSFAFNVGNQAFCRSTLARLANLGRFAEACAELSRWVYADGKKLPGLVRRRAAEREVCES